MKHGLLPYLALVGLLWAMPGCSGQAPPEVENSAEQTAETDNAAGGSAGDRPSGESVPAHEFFGVGSPRQDIAYVVDRNGGMACTLMAVKQELKRSIAAMRPSQKFFVTFYSTGPAVVMPSGQMVPATEANKQAAYQFIDDIVAVGQTDPSDALKQAFALKPTAVYLLTGGEFDVKMAALIRKLNADGQVKVHTIAFLYRGGEELLKKIADQNGGAYKYVSEDDLAVPGG
jgi:hypothetical protein